jgi:hypothetical protein
MGALGDFIDSITSGRGQDRAGRKEAEYGGSSNKSVGTSSLRPNLRPGTFDDRKAADFAKQVARAKKDVQGSDGSGSEDYKKMMAAPADYNDPQNPVSLDDVPYFQGTSVRKYKPNGIFDFLKNVMFDSKKDVLTDLRLGIGSLSGTSLPGFQKTMESMGYAGLPKEAYETAFNNFNERTKKTEDAMKGQETDDYDRAFVDPCPEGYQTDSVTGMCVPVMGADPEPIVPTPFPDLPGGGGGMTSPVLPLMDYTQPINYTAPRISPPVPQGIAGIPMTPIMV